MTTRFARTVFTCVAAALLALAALAQPVEWSGGALTTSNSWGLAGNWANNAVPVAGSDIRIATGNFFPASNSTDTIALNGDRTIGSITFDNSAGQFPTQLRLNANTGNGSNNGGFRNLIINRDASNVAINVINGANVFISGNSSTLVGSFAGLNLLLNYSGMGTVNVDGGSSLVIGGNAAGFRSATGQNAGLIKTGAGTLTMGGASANYTAGFQLAGGTLFVSASSNLTNAAQPGPFGSGTLTIDGGTKLASTATNTNGNRTFDNPLQFTGGTVTLGDTVNNGLLTFSTGLNTSGPSAFAADTTLNVLSTVTINRAMGGPGSFTKTGAGTLTLSQQASYTGGTVLREGMLQLQTSDKLPTDGDVTFDGGILRVSTSGFTTSNHRTTITSNGATFNLAGNITLNWVGDISGSGRLSTAGSGSTSFLTLSGNNTYTGGTEITAGTVKGNIGTGDLSIAAGATYNLTGVDRSISAINGAGNITLGANTLTVTGGTFSGVLSGTGGITKTGAGTLALSGVNTYAGATTISGGTVAGSIGKGDLSIGASAAYDLGGADHTVSALSGAGTVALGTNTLTTNSTSNTSFAGTITGTGGLTKEGTGTLSLTGVNTYSGPTTVTAGGLAVDGTLASALTMASGTTLSGTGQLLGNVSVSGIHAPGNSPGIQTFTNLTYNSGSTIAWELTANTDLQSTAAAAVFDQIAVNGDLDFAGVALLSLTFNLAGSSVNWTDPFWQTSHSWTIFSAANVLNAANLSLSPDAWTDSAGNDFHTILGQSGNTLELGFLSGGVQLNYNVSAVPEPSTYALLALGVVMISFGAWRRRRQS